MIAAILKCANGTRYEGEWKDNRFDGVGILVLPTGLSYQGEFREGLKNGKGTLNYADSSSYVGEFKDDLVRILQGLVVLQITIKN